MGRFRVSSADVISLGCRLNIAESERMKAMLGDADDVVVINSCAVTSEAVRQTRQAIRKTRRDRPDARLLVTGCAADIEREQIADMPEVDGLIANAAKLDPRSWNVPLPEAPPPPTRTRAFIAVQNGCDHACTFCVIPQGRGKSRSASIPDVLREVEHHLDLGAKEVVLTGVDLTSWGQDISNTLGNLVEAILDEFPQLARLRLSSVDGIEIDETLFDLLASEERLMPHLHLSMQHGHDLILKRMKRRHLRADAIAFVETARKLRPDMTFGADIIAGFPTETEAQFENALSLIDACDLTWLHVFPYSKREGTPAAKIPKQVPGPEIRARAAELRARGDIARARHLAAQVGQIHRVLTESPTMGRTEQFAEVRFASPQPEGQILTVDIASAERTHLCARM